MEPSKIWIKLYAASLMGMAPMGNEEKWTAEEIAVWAAELADKAYAEYLKRQTRAGGAIHFSVPP